MARERGKASKIKLRQPDRSGPSPDQTTLVEIVEQRRLFEQAEERQKELRRRPRPKPSDSDSASDGDDDEEEGDDEPLLSPRGERIAETVLWTVSLAILHFTLDVLVQNQYGQDIDWSRIVSRTFQAFLVIACLFYVLHPHSSSPDFVPFLPTRYQNRARQTIFLVTSVAAGCYLVHISNRYGYLAVMKRAPTLGCLWIWSVIELDIIPSLVSVGAVLGFLWWGDYSFK